VTGLEPRMKRRLTQVFLVILITLSISLLSAYLDYYDLAEADFLSRNISFENPDQENLSIDQRVEFKVFISSVFSLIFHEVIDLSEQFLRFTFTRFSFEQKTFILRC
jgi:hypothetical protein